MGLFAEGEQTLDDTARAPSSGILEDASAGRLVHDHPSAWTVSDFTTPADYTIELDATQLRISRALSAG
jgi:hypothetical protein